MVGSFTLEDSVTFFWFLSSSYPLYIGIPISVAFKMLGAAWGGLPLRNGITSGRFQAPVRRATAKVRATAISAVVSVSSPGVFPTGIPCRVAAVRSMFR
jgi:hypothetical protein